MSSANNNGEVGLIPTQKLSLLQLVETEKNIFSKEIMSNLQMKKMIARESFGGEFSSDVV